MLNQKELEAAQRAINLASDSFKSLAKKFESFERTGSDTGKGVTNHEKPAWSGSPDVIVSRAGGIADSAAALSNNLKEGSFEISDEVILLATAVEEFGNLLGEFGKGLKSSCDTEK